MCNGRLGSYPHSTANPAYDTISQKPIKVITSGSKNKSVFVPRLKKTAAITHWILESKQLFAPRLDF